MNETEINEIITYINSKYQEKVPSLVRKLIGGKIKKIESFPADELPPSLRKCSVEELLLLVQEGLRQGTIKL